MERVRRLVQSVFGRDARDAAVVIAHEPTASFLGPGFVHVERADALELDPAEADRLLVLHASDPGYQVVPADRVAAFDAA